ncbi:sulfite exporter TauE/SafE family protein [Kaistia dalseonensis]|uniref:Probable membrane transporter protein n=1 Tax=Kaistia dalseonensis TaxID=410840 RepID=A0ABU0HAC9_9HYPH|nr:sulfite exporter TauE/SafE family protein [Kaistia dalseonensis]MCX5496639.1 sulfite exporter TauE/SafE family protein [Kaistia dalseonensis]MDQ0439262.1 putative membrane protein YfcA [Kaistia dalseonensis]
MQSLPFLLPEGFAWGHFAGSAAMVFVAALLQGIGGLGFAMVSAPLAVLFFPELAPGPLLVLGAGLALLGLLRERSEIDWPAAGTLMAGRIGGTLVAGATLTILPTTLFSIVFALLILTGVTFSLSGWRVEATRPNMMLAGLASGLMGTITSSGAPPFAIVMQHVAPARLRATLSCVFFFGAILSLLMLAIVGRFSTAQLWLGLMLFPLMILGFIASNPLTRLFSREAVRMMLLTLSALGAIGILVRSWVLWS